MGTHEEFWTDYAVHGYLVAQFMVVLLCACGELTSQPKQSHTWYFGRKAALEFAQSAVNPVLWNDSAYAGAGVFWDQTGTPILYAGWKTVYNAAGDRDTLESCG